jgi:enterochelin esterase-like enzyme
MHHVSQPVALRHERLYAYRSHHLRSARTIDLLLPPEALGSPSHVLLLNDGQELRSLRVAETLSALIGAGQVGALAVVAIHASDDRLREYGVAGIPDYQGRGNRADAYSAFVCEELLPDLSVRYQLPTQPVQRTMAGLSLGGLMAFDLAWMHPEIFGAAAVFSGSFWWRSDDSSVAAKIASRIAHQRVRSAAQRPPIRIWLQAGTADETNDRDGDGVIDSIQDTRDLVAALIRRGFHFDQDLIYREIPGGRHEPATWAELLPEVLIWAADSPRQ